MGLVQLGSSCGAHDDDYSEYMPVPGLPRGSQVTYKEFDVGHLDVTFAVKDDIRHYVLSRLQLREWLQRRA